MPRRSLSISTNLPYHVNNKTNNSDFFRLNMSTYWKIFCDQLLILHYFYGFEIQSFVLMSNHYHMVVTTPDGNLSQGLRYFHTEVSRKMNSIEKRSNHLFGGRYHWKLIENQNYYLNAIKYIYRNPVRANIVSQVEAYKYSTLHSTIGLSRAQIPLYDRYGFCDFTNHAALAWLNEPFTAEIEIDLLNYLQKRRKK